MKPNEYFFEFENVKTRYLRLGKGDPLLFLHGAILGPDPLHRVLEKLSEKFEVFAPHIPPFGRADSLAGKWDFDDYGRYFDHFINQLNLKKVAIIGNSFGGGVAVATTIRNNQVSKLILNASVGISNQTPLRKMLGVTFSDFTLRSLKNSSGKKDFWPSLVDFVILLKKHLFSLKKTALSISEMVQKGIESDLAKIKVPTLILWGKKDFVLPMEIGFKMKEKIKGAELRIVDGGHSWIQARPEELTDLIYEFISKG